MQVQRALDWSTGPDPRALDQKELQNSGKLGLFVIGEAIGCVAASSSPMCPSDRH